MAGIIVGIQGDKGLLRSYLEKFYFPRRQMQWQLVEEAIATGELRASANPDLVIGAHPLEEFAYIHTFGVKHLAQLVHEHRKELGADCFRYLPCNFEEAPLTASRAR